MLGGGLDDPQSNPQPTRQQHQTDRILLKLASMEQAALQKLDETARPGIPGELSRQQQNFKLQQIHGLGGVRLAGVSMGTQLERSFLWGEGVSMKWECWVAK